MQKMKNELDEANQVIKDFLDQIENGPRKCSLHEKEVKTTYCKSCSATICPTCIISEHIQHKLITLDEEAEYKKFFMEGLKQQAMGVNLHWAKYQKALKGFKEDVVKNCGEQISLVEARANQICTSVLMERDLLKEEIRSHALVQKEKINSEIKRVEDYKGKIMSLYAMFDSKVPSGVHLDDVANIDLDKMKEMMETLTFDDGHTGLTLYVTSRFESDSFEITREMLGKIKNICRMIASPILPKVIGTIDAPDLSKVIDNSSRDPACKDQISICDDFVVVTGYKSVEKDRTKPYYAMIFKESAFQWEHQIAEGTTRGSIDTGICMGKVHGNVYLFVSYNKMQQVEVWNVDDKSLVSAFVFQNLSESTDIRLMACKDNKLYLTEAYFNAYSTSESKDEPEDPMVTFQTMTFGSGLNLEQKVKVKTTFSQRRNIQGFCVANLPGKRDAFIVSTKCPDQVTAFDEDGSQLWVMSDVDFPGNISWDGKYFFVVTGRNRITLVNDSGMKIVTLPLPMDSHIYQDLDCCLACITGMAVQDNIVQDNILGIFVSRADHSENEKSSEILLFRLGYKNKRCTKQEAPK